MWATSRRFKERMQLSWAASIGLFLSFLIFAAVAIYLIGDIFTQGKAAIFPSTKRGQSTMTASPTAVTLTAVNGIAPSQINNWILIPQWLAGSWQSDSEMILNDYDYSKGRTVIDTPIKVNMKRQSTIGMQRDSTGQIWYCAITPYERTIETTSFTEHQQMEKISLLKSDPTEITIYCSANITRSSKDTKQVIITFKEETVATYDPLNDGLIQVSLNIKDFDQEGQPLYSSQAICTETRTKSFTIIDKDERGDLHAQFKAFLLANGMSNLVYN